MSQDSSRDLMDALVRDLRPVQPSLSLRTSMAIVGALWVAVLALMALSGSRPNAGTAGTLYSLHWGVTIGLGLVALGGTLAGLAAATPGRESERRLGIMVAGAGFLVAISSFAAAGLASGGSDRGPAGSCFVRSLGSALPGMLGILWLSLRGWVTHPRLAAALGLAGASAFGAVATQVLCSGIGAQHLVFGHFSVPVVLASVGTVPVAILLRRTAY